MSGFKALFQIVENKHCPLYTLGDSLQLTDKALLPPRGKAVCLILAREMTALLFSLLSQGKNGQTGETVYSCSGCSGLIKFKMKTEQPAAESSGGASLAQLIATHLALPAELAQGVERIGLFQMLDRNELPRILPCFHYKKFARGAVLLRKGDKGGEVLILLSGKVAVLDGRSTIIVLGRGEVLGEMSQLSAKPVSATVSAIENTEALSISGDDLRRILDENPTLNNYFLRLLAERLSRSNEDRLKETNMAMSGTLEELPQIELFQIFHMNAKSGMLTIDLSQGTARIVFREGNLIEASYNGARNEEAIYRVIAEKNEGRFRYSAGLTPALLDAPEIGDFMKILMDALRRLDEETSGSAEEIDAGE